MTLTKKDSKNSSKERQNNFQEEDPKKIRKFNIKDYFRSYSRIGLALGGGIILIFFLGLIASSLKEKRILGSNPVVLSSMPGEESSISTLKLPSFSQSSSSGGQNSTQKALDLEAKKLEEGLHSSQGEVKILEERVKNIEERLSAIERLRERIYEVWKNYQLLITALSSEQPFSKELNVFKKMINHSIEIKHALEALEPYAPLGAPTLENLIKSFPEVKDEIIKDPSYSLSLWGKLKLALKSLIEITYKGESKKDSQDPLSILEDSWNEMSNKNFSKAIIFLEKLQQKGRPKLKTWLAHAKAREKILEVRHLLKSYIILEMLSIS